MLETYSEQLISRMVLLTLGSDNSISKLGAEQIAKSRSHFERSMCSYMHMKSIFIAEAAIQNKKINERHLL